jgi:hypothetical protein
MFLLLQCYSKFEIGMMTKLKFGKVILSFILSYHTRLVRDGALERVAGTPGILDWKLMPLECWITRSSAQLRTRRVTTTRVVDAQPSVRCQKASAALSPAMLLLRCLR